MNPERWRQVDQLFQAALERAPEERTAYISKACGGDDSLRCEVEALLAADGQAEGFIEAPAYAVAAPLIVGDDAQSLLGKTIGHYQIISLIGKGGMGEVYRARDTRLGREVAIKVLPREYSPDADRLRRFEQEARAAGMLNHPNVLTIYDIGMHENRPYLVTELLTGETLRERMRGEALPLRRAVDYALQIARGLAAAHEKGIVHRDLKPENLFLTKDGRVKILDFGLAKLKPPPAVPLAGMDTKSSTQPLGTAPGVVMGTVGYMSPEQVKAEEVDHRSDIFAFGAILYEMLCGRSAFQGDSAVEVMNAILKEEPPEIAEPGREIPPALARVMRHCLEKIQEDRFQSIRDIAFDLEGLAESSGAASAAQAPPSRQTQNWMRLAWIAPCVLLLMTLPFVVIYFLRAQANTRVFRLSVLPPEKTTFGSIAISPDGRRLAFVATAYGKNSLWVRPLDSITAQALPDTDDARYPFWSPDSRFIGFFARGKLKKIEISGGPATTLCDAVEARGGTWSRDEVIVFAPNYLDALYRVPASGGVATPATTLNPSGQENSHRWPHFLPDDRHFVFFVRSAQRDVQGIYVGSLDAKERKRLVGDSSSVAYASSGHLLFVREETLVAQPFDMRRLSLAGEAVPVVEQVRFDNSSGAEFSVSEDGVLVYRRSSAISRQLIWFDRRGIQLGAIAVPADYTQIRLSPDEKRVAGNRLDPQTRSGDIWLFDLPRGVLSRFTSHPSYEWRPVWSPDGNRIVFGTNRDGPMDLYLKALSGTASEGALLKSGIQKIPNDWSRDGQFILYDNLDPKTYKHDLWVLPLAGNRQPFPLLRTEFDEQQGQFSPDGQWVAFVSDESGRYEVYVQSFPTPGSRWPVSTGGGTEPRWRRDGKELFYITADGKLMAVELKGGSTFKASAPKALFEPRLLDRSDPLDTNYAVTANGQRFLINSAVEPTPITVVLNWAAELKR